MGSWYVYLVYCMLSFSRVHLEEILIDFREIVGQHSGENLAEGVWETLQMYGLLKKVSSVMPIIC